MSPNTQAAPPLDLSSGPFRLAPDGNGRLLAAGPLTFASARRAREVGLDAIEAAGEGGLIIDCQGITASDSAGLAVLLDWLAVARSRGRSLRFAQLPQGLAALGRISEVSELLERGG